MVIWLTSSKREATGRVSGAFGALGGAWATVEFRLLSAVERRDRQAAHGVQAGGRVDHLGHRIDGDGRGGHVTVDTTGDLRIQRRRALDADGVERLGSAEIRLHVERDDRLGVAVAEDVWGDAAYLYR